VRDFPSDDSGVLLLAALFAEFDASGSFRALLSTTLLIDTTNYTLEFGVFATPFTFFDADFGFFTG
jgi:hypothetical protein